MSGGRLTLLLAAATALIASLGLLAEVGHHTAGLSMNTTAFFSLSYEANLPTWYSSSLLLGAALLLASIGLHVGEEEERRFRLHYYLLSALFTYMSLDEAVELHEHLGGLFALHGFLYFSWVVPGAAVVLALGLFFLPFVRHLPRATARRFVVAGSIYVGGALLMELPLGYWTEQAGDDNLTYALIDFVEETLEMGGVVLFIIALFDHGRALQVRAASSPAPAQNP